SRRTRVARGSGTTVGAVNQLMKQFGEMRKVMRQVASGGAPPGLGRAASMAPRPRDAAVPPGFEALAAGMRSAPAGAAKGKKKKGGRVTPPKQR
ncbi:MAG: signal recognition particle protein, partial [Acidobacteriota bacterium]|nr:signal recognition particle protein [Acidobacteriota bacterium]